MTPTRREILAATAPLAADMALAPLVRPAQALAVPASPDAALLALRERWHSTLAAFNDALEAKDAVHCERYEALRALDWPEWPSIDHPSYVEEIERVAKIRVAAMDLVDADVIRKAAAADAAETATSKANRAVVDEIAATPAHTLAGVAFKLTVSEEWLHGNEPLLDSVLGDIAAFAAAYPTLTIATA